MTCQFENGMSEMSRRRLLELGAGTLMAALAGGARRLSGSVPQQAPLIHGRIPSTGEKVPAVGLGTWQTFDVGEHGEQRAHLAQVLRLFHGAGGRIIDSSPMYGSSEEVFGDLATETGLSGDFWVATKVWIDGQAAGRQQMQESMALLERPNHIELMQIHNLRDWELHLETLEAWKAQGRFDYVGITTSSERQYDDVARILESESDRIDFLQINYSLAERRAEERILPMARDLGIAVMLNRPFAGGRLFGALARRPLPDWAVEIDCTAWSQIFIKYVLGHPAVTCAIPATSDPNHLMENMAGGRGRLPDAELRRRMERLV